MKLKAVYLIIGVIVLKINTIFHELYYEYIFSVQKDHLTNLNLLLESHIEQSNSLTTYSDISKFSGLSRKTIYNYIKDGKFIEGVHYYKNDKGTPTFIPSAMIQNCKNQPILNSIYYYSSK